MYSFVEVNLVLNSRLHMIVLGYWSIRHAPHSCDVAVFVSRGAGSLRSKPTSCLAILLADLPPLSGTDGLLPATCVPLPLLRWTVAEGDSTGTSADLHVVILCVHILIVRGLIVA